MNNLQRLAIVGFAAAGMTMFGAAAMADTYHSREAQFAGPKGAASFGVTSFASNGHHHEQGHEQGKEGNNQRRSGDEGKDNKGDNGHQKNGGKAIYKKFGAVADKHGAASWNLFSYAD
ncbi:hypothetical protein GCM10010191_27220 [Actinomadura vinacea]|uniref:Lactococcin 972 family bacteriocin n=1 Tax=Actinomadura vinacea TaxID=115336 RepID=A0ABN3IXF1_9ACTN